MNACFFERAHLVVHERDQGADHHGDAALSPMPRDGRHLVAQALAAACGHQYQGIATLSNVRDDPFLLAAESAVTKDVSENVPGLG